MRFLRTSPSAAAPALDALRGLSRWSPWHVIRERARALTAAEAKARAAEPAPTSFQTRCGLEIDLAAQLGASQAIAYIPGAGALLCESCLAKLDRAQSFGLADPSGAA